MKVVQNATDTILKGLVENTLTTWYDERIEKIDLFVDFSTYTEVFRGTKIETINLPNLKYLDGFALFYNTNIKTVIAPKLEMVNFVHYYNMDGITTFDVGSVKEVRGHTKGYNHYVSPVANTTFTELDFRSLEKITDYFAIYNFKSLKKVWIPISCTYIPFRGILNINSDAIIYVEHESKPDGWDDKWISGSNTIIWGATRKQYEEA